MKRLFLFGLTNIAVIALASVVMRLLGVDGWMTEQSIQYQPLLVFSLIFGFAGALVSLAMSKWMAIRGTGAKVITQPSSEIEQWLVATVRRQADAAGIGMPDVAIYDAPEINAFATGARRDSALVAVSTGLLRGMTRDEAEAVLAHEVSHVANGDMVTMTLIQGVMNTFVIFLSRIVGFFVDRVVLKNERGTGIGYFATVMVAQVVLGLLASIVVSWFSRQREFRADAGGARLAGPGKMAAALRRLQSQQTGQALPKEMSALGISGFTAGGFKRLFMTHPPLDERIAAIEAAPFN
ncbi:MAG: protease HtpX [Pseudomonadota bacterium]